MVMKNVWKWFNGLSARSRDSAIISGSFIGLVSTVFSIIGFSLEGVTNNWKLSLVVVLVVFAIGYFLAYVAIGRIFKDSIDLTIGSTAVEISTGNIFDYTGYKVIGCDSHFDTRVDDVIISKKSLHGQLVLEHGKKDEIEKIVEEKAKILGIDKDEDGLYDFPLGTVIRYDSSVDGNTYLMVALTKQKRVNGTVKAYTSMPEYERTLREMWDQINGMYVYNDVVLPLLGSGIARFEGANQSNDSLLRCMLCTLNSSDLEFKSTLKVVIYDNAKELQLYEYKDSFKSIPGR